MADLFVSYKAEDRRRVEPLVRALESDGFTVWWDSNIGGGERWREAILRNLEEARCVLVVWSRRSIGPEGEFVQDEASRAKRRRTYLPVSIDKVDPPLGFGETQALSLRGWKGDRSDSKYQALLEAVRQRVGHEPRAGMAAPGRVNRRTAILAGASAALLAAGGVGTWLLRKPGAAATSIAVLPFANLSGDPAQAYFSDGIAEELRSALARIAGLKVVARTSSEAVRDEDAKTAARKLDVAHILTGSVRRSPSIVRISAQLVDGRDGTERWSQDYDRPTGDALQIQSDIAARVASALALQLVPGSGGRLTLGGTNDPEAHDLFLKGLAARQSQHKAENLKRAIALLDQAIAIDPGYAEAYALKAISLAELSSGFSASGPQMEQMRAQAADCANKALAISPNLPSGHAALAAVAADGIDYARALDQFRQASAGGADAVILGDYARFLAQLGFTGEAHRIGKQVIALDPLNVRSYVPDAAAYYSARQYPQTIAASAKLLALSPDAPPALVMLGDALMNLGKYDQARSVYKRIPADDVFRITSEGILDERLRNHDASKRAVDRIEQTYGSAASYQLAQLHAQRGALDPAFAALEQAVGIADPGLISLPTDPFIDPLRSDARFKKVRSRINFPPGLPG